METPYPGLKVEQSPEKLRMHFDRRVNQTSNRRMYLIAALNILAFILFMYPVIGSLNDPDKGAGKVCPASIYLMVLLVTLPLQFRLSRVDTGESCDLVITLNAVTVTINGADEIITKPLIGTLITRYTGEMTSLWLVFENGEGVRAMYGLPRTAGDYLEGLIRRFCDFSDDVFCLEA